MNILAIETSCDETAVAIVKDGVEVLASQVATSAETHRKWGGIVPEVAARKQLEFMIPVLTDTLIQCPDYDAIAVTVGPGLVGSLLIGVETARTIALATGKPLIPVNHVQAHMYANFVRYQASGQNSSRAKPRDNHRPITFPAISLVTSGGHTELYLMTSPKELKWLGGTIDDAAGEAFDKTARIIGLGAGGGLAIQNESLKFKVQSSKFKVNLPRPIINDNTLNFSFSGLKTAVMREWKKSVNRQSLMVDRKIPNNVITDDQRSTINDQLIALYAYEIQEAITDVLVTKTLHAARIHEAESILISGGVAANARLRDKFSASINEQRLTVSFFSPPPALCTDNAVTIASCAFFRGQRLPWQSVKAEPALSSET